MGLGQLRQEVEDLFLVRRKVVELQHTLHQSYVVLCLRDVVGDEM
jgi:hypothetical protein